MKKQVALCVAIGCMSTIAATNYDLLGRNGSKMNSPMVYKNVDYAKAKKTLNQKPLMRQPTGVNGLSAIEGAFNTTALIYGSRGTPYMFYLKRYNTNGTSSSAYMAQLGGPYDQEYLGESNNVFIPINLVQNYTPTGIVNSGDDTHVAHYTMTEQYPNSGYASKTYWNVEFGDDYAKRGDIGWYDNGYGDCQECADVGMYLDIGAVPVRLNPSKTASYVKYNSGENLVANPIREVSSSKAASLLKETTKNTTVFITDGLPQNPRYKTPQVYLGLHTRKNDPDVPHNIAAFYGAEARDLDNYIYENRTVEVVAAGDYWIRNHEAELNAQAHAANAITVGAVDANTKKITDYTSNRSRYCTGGAAQCINNNYYLEGSSKPEVYNYSEFYMNGDYKRNYTHWYTGQMYDPTPNYDGTEAAATYTAAQVAALLRANPFYRWHPEVVKAVLLSSGKNYIYTPYPHGETPVTNQIPTYKSVVFNRFHNQYFHESHYWIGEWERLYTHSEGDKNEIRFCVKRPANRYAFNAAIAWLSSGNDIATLGMVPQDFDIYAYESSTGNPDNIPNLYNYIGRSISGKNAFEKFSFWTSAEYITFRILLFTEHGDSENRGQVVLGFDVSATD